MNAVATVEPREPRALTAPTPADLLRYALEQKAEPQYLRELMQLQREWEADQARKEYVAAMALFKMEDLVITKDKHVQFTTAKGPTAYDHATIGNVVAVIVPALGKHGFSHRWDTDQKDAKISVTCTITHSAGHSEKTTLIASADESGGKNSIQSIGSTVTYLQRYTLLAATGLATSDGDDDGDRSNELVGAGDPTQASGSPERQKLIADLYAVADEGIDALTRAWRDLSEANRKLVGADFGAIKKKALAQ